MLFYAAVGAFGLLFLFGMLFLGDMFGGDHDAGHDMGHGDAGPGFLSARVMAAFLTAFGAGGLVARYFALGHPAASAIGIGTGMACAFAVYQFAKLLYSQQSSSVLEVAGLVGQTAEVTVAIPADGLGQVTLTTGGEQTSQIARSVDGKPLKAGASVTITAMSGSTVLVSAVRPAAAGGSR